MRRPAMLKAVLYGVLLAGAVLSLLPVVWMVSASLMPTGQATAFPPGLFPGEVTLTHYRALFTRLDLGRYFFNSTLLASAVTLVSLLFNSMAGYAFAKFRFAGRRRLFRFLLGGLVLPAQVAMLPLFLLMKELGLINTYAGVVLPVAAGIFGIFLIRQYVLAVPDTLIEAARIDGAGEFRIYWSIVLPLCRPALLALALFTFVGTWNDFMWPLIILTDDSMYTLPVALATLAGEHVQDTELMMAASVMTTLPVMLVFLVLQRYYVEAVLLGGLKR